MVYSIISVIAIIVILIFTGAILKNIFSLTGSERTKYVRGFKQGECAVIYFIAIPLYYMGLFYAGGGWFFSFFNALELSAKTVVLNFAYDSVKGLAEVNVIYMVAMYICFLACAFNSTLLFVSLISQYFVYAFTSLKWKFSKKKKVLFIGINEGNFYSARSVGEDSFGMLAGEFSKDEAGELFTKRVPYMDVHDITEFSCDMLKKALWEKRALNIIINTEDDSKNIALAGKLMHVIDDYAKDNLSVNLDGLEKDEATRKKKIVIDNFHRVGVYVFKNPSYSTIYDELEKDSFGCIHCISKYEQIALDFMNNYPISLFMNEDFIDESNALIKDESVVQYQLFGLGKINEEILFSGLSENQFLTEKDGKIVPKCMDYHIFDRMDVSNIRRLTQTLFRFTVDFKQESDRKDYLEIPEDPGRLYFHEADFSSGEFIRELEKISCTKNRYTYAIVSYDSDIENIALAQLLLDLRERNKWENYYIFARVYGDPKAYEIFSRPNVFAIGNEQKVVYDYGNIVNDRLSSMAVRRNRDYEGKIKTEDEVIAADYKWFIMRYPIERMSNIYCVMAIRFKLNLMGLDYVSIKSDDQRPALTEEEFRNLYEPNKDKYAILEHYRWNAFYLTRGYIPASIEEILNGEANGKDHVSQKHGNLTTMDGLVEFRKLVAKSRNISEEEADVIRYDYDIMNGAYKYLNAEGYKIVKKVK